jgi:thymidylate synthase (methanogen type)
MVKGIEVTTLAEAYKQAIQYIVWNHREFETEDEELVWRSKDTLVLHVIDPSRNIGKLADYYPMGLGALDTYVDEILGRDDREVKNTADDFVYTYFDRLCKYEVLRNEKVVATDGVERHLTRYYEIDQINEIVKRLNASRSTRRACAITWKPYDENYTNLRSPPCLQWLKCEIVDDKLNMFTLWRSRDVLLGMGANIYAIHFLHTAIAARCQCAVGFYEDINVDAHIYYKRDGNYLKRWLQ